MKCTIFTTFSKYFFFFFSLFADRNIYRKIHRHIFNSKCVVIKKMYFYRLLNWSEFLCIFFHSRRLEERDDAHMHQHKSQHHKLKGIFFLLSWKKFFLIYKSKKIEALRASGFTNMRMQLSSQIKCEYYCKYLSIDNMPVHATRKIKIFFKTLRMKNKIMNSDIFRERNHQKNMLNFLFILLQFYLKMCADSNVSCKLW